METRYEQLEVLLMTGTTLTSGYLCKKDDSLSGAHFTEEERLEEACWNGFLQNTLPEVSLQTATGGLLYLWQVKKAVTFLELELGEAPTPIERQYSISPYSFLFVESNN